MQLTCPKCQGVMRQYERSGVTIDQCAECRGVFLDRGELERLTDAENAWHGAAAPPPQPAHQAYPSQGGYQQPYQQGHGHGYPKKRKKSFFEEIFD